MKKMLTLTLEEVKAAARKAYDDGTLLCLTAQDENQYCFSATVNGKECVCAVGAAFPPEFREYLKTTRSDDPTLMLNDIGISSLIDHNFLVVDPKEADEIADIAGVHDDVQGAGGPQLRSHYLAEFLLAIDHPKWSEVKVSK